MHERTNYIQFTVRNTGCIKKVDPFKFKLAITYCINLTTLIATELMVRKNV